MSEKGNGIEAFWKQYLKASSQKADTEYYEHFCFGITEKSATRLLALVRQGKKRATASSIHYFALMGLPLPQVGSLSVVTDWNGEPQCIIKTTAVTTLPFGDMTFDICGREGEDKTLGSWQKGHTAFFMAEGEQLGYRFSRDMPVVLRILRWCTHGEMRTEWPWGCAVPAGVTNPFLNITLPTNRGYARGVALCPATRRSAQRPEHSLWCAGCLVAIQFEEANPGV